MAEEPLATVPDRPVRVKITYKDGSSAEATIARIPHESEITEGEKYEVLDEGAVDVYGRNIPTTYSPAPAKKAASKEADK